MCARSQDPAKKTEKFRPKFLLMPKQR
jgi:hypothetical protein